MAFPGLSEFNSWPVLYTALTKLLFVDAYNTSHSKHYGVTWAFHSKI